MPYDQECEVARQAARRAGEVMKRYQENGFEVGRKQHFNDVVTEADLECQRTIIETIAEAFPEDGVLAEEEEVRPGDEDRVWVVDPIDGTRNFVNGFPWFCTSIALREGEELKVGVVYAPMLDEMFYATEGGGAFLNGESLQVSGRESLRGAVVFVSQVSGWRRGKEEREIRFNGALLERDANLRRFGSAALSLANVAAGRADGRILQSIFEWDIAAGVLLVREAGGAARVQSSVFEDRLEVVASNGLVQQELEEVVDTEFRAKAGSSGS